VGLTHVGGVLGTLGENALVLAMVALVILLPPRARVPEAPLSAAAPSGARTTELPRPGGWSPR
jgi:hypothetical protein